MQSKSQDVEARAHALAGEDEGPAQEAVQEPASAKPSIGKAAPLVEVPKLPVVEPSVAPKVDPAPAAPEMVEAIVTEPYQEKQCVTDAYGNAVSCMMVTKYRRVRRMVPKTLLVKADPEPAPAPEPCPCGNPACVNPELCNCAPNDSVGQVYAYAATPTAVYRHAPVATYFANHTPVRTAGAAVARGGVRVARGAARVVTAPIRAIRGVRAARCQNCE